ncbi:hypothetical protein ACH5RR_023619 [Cinchona calisaya]|uniref:Uncharacterized protein n=1 Tax=Cinchona calisaya TaxID=153742 RepID=A0ABD2ZB55_9GENT
MMLDESKSQEMIEQKIKNAPPGQGMVRMVSSEEWEEVREVQPRAPFESKLACPNVQTRTGEPLQWMSRIGRLMCLQMVSLVLKIVLVADLISMTYEGKTVNEK